MDFRDLLHALRRSWWVLLSTLVASVGIAALTTAAATPLYATRVTFFVTTPSNGVTDAYQGGLFSQQRVKSYASVLTGDRLAKSVADDGSLGLTPAQIQSRITARVIPDTVLLEAVVTDPQTPRSQRVAEALAQRFTALVEDLETPPGRSESAVKVQIIAGPAADPAPVSPRPARNLALALLLGLLVGGTIAVLRDLLDTTVKSAETLTKLADGPILGVVPFDAGARRQPLVAHGSAHTSRAEAFRQLRTNLQFADVDHPVKVIAVTSAVPEEGKSTTAVNLALAFAESGARVLLIEGDLRRPRVADYLGIEGSAGLSNVLAGQVEVDDVLQPWGDRGLRVLPSGVIPPNPSELLGSAAMTSLIEGQRNRFDMIIIDTPPLLPVTDGAVVAVKVDGAILVIRSGRTGGPQVLRAVADLRRVDARLLGCVLNMHPAASETPYYYSGATPKRVIAPAKRTPGGRHEMPPVDADGGVTAVR